MKEIELREKVESAHKEYDPIEIGEGVSVDATRDVVNGSYVVEGNITKNDNNIGRFTMNEKQSRLFVNLTCDGLKRNTIRDTAETITSIMLQLIPAEEE